MLRRLGAYAHLLRFTYAQECKAWPVRGFEYELYTFIILITVCRRTRVYLRVRTYVRTPMRARLLRFLSRAHANFPVQGVARSVRIKRGCFIEDVAPRGGRGSVKMGGVCGCGQGSVVCPDFPF